MKSYLFTLILFFLLDICIAQDFNTVKTFSNNEVTLFKISQTPKSSFIFTLDSAVLPNCSVDSASAFFTVAGGVPPYTYLWNNGATDEDLIDVPSGQYFVTITDFSGTSHLDSVDLFAVGEVQLTLDSLFDPNCALSADGAIYINSVIDTPVIQCSSPVLAINEFMYRPANSNGVDPNTGEYIELIGPAGMDLSCYVLTDGDWTITIPQGTIMPSDGFFTIGNDIVWGAGTFDLDAENCNCFTEGFGGQALLILADAGEYVALFDNSATFIDGVIYGNPSPGNTPSVQAINTNPAVGCNLFVVTPAVGSFMNAPGSVPNGTSIIRSPDGTGNWTTQIGGSLNGCNSTLNSPGPIVSYQWSNGSTTQDLTGLNSGQYTLFATSNLGCIDSVSYTLNEQNVITLSDSTVGVDCYGSNTGAIYITNIDSTYSLLWSNLDTLSQISGLYAGDYQLTVSDTSGCVDTYNFTIQEPDTVLTVNLMDSNMVSCFGGTDGSLTIIADGGTPGYSYSWLPSGSTDVSVSGLSAGIYVVTVTDSLNCQQVETFNVIESSLIQVMASTTAVSCGTTNSGTASVSVSGGNPSYAYFWDVLANNQTTATATGLINSTYSVTITDSLGCESVTNGIFVDQSQDIDAADVPIEAIDSILDCDLNPTGLLTINTSGDFTYLWSDGQSTSTASGLDQGLYTVTITNNSGCTITQSASVEAPFVPEISPYILSFPLTSTQVNLGDQVLINGGNDQGSLGVQYLWYSNDQNIIFEDDTLHGTFASSMTTGSFELFIIATSTATGCQDSGSVTLHAVTTFDGIPNAFTPNNDGVNDLLFPIGLTTNEIRTYRIYNRWGQEVYNGDELLNGGWDGRFNAVEQPSDEYLYLLEYDLGGGQENKVKKGTFLLLR